MVKIYKIKKNGGKTGKANGTKTKEITQVSWPI